ncbi:hypothetical protein D3C78_1251280 [compost metagenome]
MGNDAQHRTGTGKQQKTKRRFACQLKRRRLRLQQTAYRLLFVRDRLNAHRVQRCVAAQFA